MSEEEIVKCPICDNECVRKEIAIGVYVWACDDCCLIEGLDPNFTGMADEIEEGDPV